MITNAEFKTIGRKMTQNDDNSYCGCGEEETRQVSKMQSKKVVPKTISPPRPLFPSGTCEIYWLTEEPMSFIQQIGKGMRISYPSKEIGKSNVSSIVIMIIVNRMREKLWKFVARWLNGCGKTAAGSNWCVWECWHINGGRKYQGSPSFSDIIFIYINFINAV